MISYHLKPRFVPCHAPRELDGMQALWKFCGFSLGEKQLFICISEPSAPSVLCGLEWLLEFPYSSDLFLPCGPCFTFILGGIHRQNNLQTPPTLRPIKQAELSYSSTIDNTRSTGHFHHGMLQIILACVRDCVLAFSNHVLC